MIGDSEKLRKVLNRSTGESLNLWTEQSLELVGYIKAGLDKVMTPESSAFEATLVLLVAASMVQWELHRGAEDAMLFGGQRQTH